MSREITVSVPLTFSTLAPNLVNSFFWISQNRSGNFCSYVTNSVTINLFRGWFLPFLSLLLFSSLSLPTLKWPSNPAKRSTISSSSEGMTFAASRHLPWALNRLQPKTRCGRASNAHAFLRRPTLIEKALSFIHELSVSFFIFLWIHCAQQPRSGWQSNVFWRFGRR